MPHDHAWLDIAGIRAPEAVVARHRRTGAWRAESPLTDLWKWRDRTPDAPAIVAYRSGVGREQLSYQQYADWVDRFAAGLAQLGVGPGTVVAVQLPNWWQTNAMLLAALRVGAVVAPLMPTLGTRELELILRRVGAAVCVTPDEWRGTDYAGRLAGLAPKLPRLRHRIVLGEARRSGEVGFTDHFVRRDWRPEHATTPAEIDVDPDRAALVLFTSGTTGGPKGAVHSLNTIHAHTDFLRAWTRGPADRIFTPHAATHLGGILGSNLCPLLVGGCSLMLDVWEPSHAATMLAAEGATFLSAAPVFLNGLMAELRRRGEAIPSLQVVATSGTTVLPQIVTDVVDTLGVTLYTVWGMTEAGNTFTGPDDPADWAAHSVGRPPVGTEIDLRATEPVTESRPGQLMIRGAGVCLATLDRDGQGVTLTHEQDDGWYDTGDLAVPDGRNGIRLAGRLADRIGGVFMVPAADVEAALRDHPALADVTLVGLPGEDGTEQICAVVVPSGTPPELDELREFLTGRGMTEWYLPTRSVIRAELPYNALGKVNKALLRAQLADVA
ncbi:hypothetical protein E1211_03640 [Micromonospora sp. 15K316]|uniref:AMP-binding protein n=1 Tax=Micromonospora sp. 15K316 TaxID=2530376 RepID=UPI00104EF1A0|nr:AMP-binding protein [Micromonospora sp. 15K316]TDC39656.1 hypothetical protein E1211_03640 [Micromonospora sp. 15K316]